MNYIRVICLGLFLILSSQAHAVDFHIPINTEWWFGPAASLDVLVWETRTHEYKLGASPGIGYGVKYSPSWWTATDSFLAIDCFVQMQAITIDGAFSYFNIDFLPVVSLFDWFGVGFGLRTGLPLTHDRGVQTTGILSIGIRKSL